MHMPVKLISTATGYTLPIRPPSRRQRWRCQTKGCGNRRPAIRLNCSTCRMLAWRANNPELASFRHLEESAKRRGIQFLLTLEEFTAWGHAHNYFRSKGRRTYESSVDRIRQDGPYSLDNIQVLTISENSAKERARQLGRSHPYFT